MNLPMMDRSPQSRTSEFAGAERRREFKGAERSQEFVGEECRVRNRGWLNFLHTSAGQEQDGVLCSRRKG